MVMFVIAARNYLIHYNLMDISGDYSLSTFYDNSLLNISYCLTHKTHWIRFIIEVLILIYQ